jgi:hypothetical protein
MWFCGLRFDQRRSSCEHNRKNVRRLKIDDDMCKQSNKKGVLVLNDDAISFFYLFFFSRTRSYFKKKEGKDTILHKHFA